jgi:hypothetical protein
MKYFLIAIISGLIGFSAWSGHKLYTITETENKLKYDYADVNLIKYGLFNIDLWKTKIFGILEKQTGSFKLKASDFNAIQREVEKYLLELHEDYFASGKIVDLIAESEMDNKNAVGKLLMGIFKGKIEKQLEQIDFKSKIPNLAKQLTNELKKKSPEIQKAITSKISAMIAAETEKEIVDQRQVILDKYEADNVDNLTVQLKESISALQSQKKQWITYSIGGLLFAFLLSLLLIKWMTFRLSMVMSTLVATVFLVLGISLPMIVLDARLSKVDLTILGEAVHFDEQFMYYQSKSIIDVTRTLLEGNGMDLKIVGLLILLFSIVLPFSKMLTSLIYMYAKKIRSIKFLEVLIFHLGKWSMADVFVVAIFMSYIGFYGLLNSQLGAMENQGDNLALDTINYSSLAPGVIYFTLYCLISIMISTFIHRRYHKKPEDDLSKIIVGNSQ